MNQKVLIVSPNCPSCQAIKQVLAKEGKLQKIQVIDVSTPEGMHFAKKLGVMGVPECAIIEGEGVEKTVRVCTDDEWKRMLKGE